MIKNNQKVVNVNNKASTTAYLEFDDSPNQDDGPKTCWQRFDDWMWHND